MKRLFQSVKKEYPDPTPGTVQGTIPDWLSGSLYRNGPGLFEVGETKYNSYLDGMAVLQRFHVSKQEVTYQCRYLNSETYKKNMAANRIAVNEFATTAFPDPCQGTIARAVSFVTETSEASDNTNVTINIVGEHLYAASDAFAIHRIDPQTLETIHKVNLMDHMPINQAAAHTHTDDTGTVHSIAYQFGRGAPKYCLIRTPPAKGDTGGYSESKIAASVTAEHAMHPSYFHTFGLTDNYYVFVEQPLLINIWKVLAAKVKKTDLVNCIEWDPSHNNNQTRFHVIDRHTGEELATYPYVAEAFLVLHHINAYEDQGHLVVDVCGYYEGDILDKLVMTKLTSDEAEDLVHHLPRPQPRRYVLPLSVDDTTSEETNLVTLGRTEATAVLKNKQICCNFETICKESEVEVPRINYKMANGKSYNYFYGVGFRPAPGCEQTIFKVNISDKSALSWYEEGCFPSEAIFVARPGGSEEDDGVLLAAIGTTGEQQENFLLVLDAKTLTETARVVFPDIRFPPDQHGVFVEDQV